jgi:hypothetical protein
LQVLNIAASERSAHAESSFLLLHPTQESRWQWQKS